MGKSNLDTIITFLLVLSILGIGLYASNLTIIGDKKEVYYDFNNVDLLNVTNVEVVSGVDFNSLSLKAGYDTSNTSFPNILFTTDFGSAINFSNIDEYVYSYKLDFSNVTTNGFYMGQSFEKKNMSAMLDVGSMVSIFDFVERTDDANISVQLASNSGLTNGRDEFKDDLLVSMRINTKDDFVVGSFSYTDTNGNPISYTNVAKLSDLTTDLVDNANAVWLIGKGGSASGGTSSDTIISTGEVLIDFIKLEYRE